jgi:hypothetical protein
VTGEGCPCCDSIVNSPQSSSTMQGGGLSSSRARLVTRTSGVGLFKAGCAAACNQYEVDEGGNIYELYSCKDYGAGIAICYYN